VHDHEHEIEEQRPVVAPEETRERWGAAGRVAGAIGNAGFGALMRQGAGILADGTAHPDVVAAISRNAGAGQSLDPSTRERMSGVLDDPLSDVTVHHDAAADQLASSVSARAFTVGSDVYFAQGEYRPGSSGGDELLAHELTHVAQQRGASTSGPLRVSEPGDALESEADAVAREAG
jgi:hypothetical protein